MKKRKIVLLISTLLALALLAIALKSDPPDGKCLFYTTGGDIHRVSTRIIEDLQSSSPPQHSFTESYTKNWPVLKGPYLGQKPPGNVPALFSPGIISTGSHELNIGFSGDGKEMIFSACGPGFQPRAILTSRLVNSKWTKPREVTFTGHEGSCSYPFISPDGANLFFNSSQLPEILVSKRSGEGWLPPGKLDFGTGYKGRSGFASTAANGNLYFFATFNGESPSIYYCEYINGQYASPVKLGPEINGKAEFRNFHPFISQDESFLLFDSQRAEDNFGFNDIFVSFREKHGKWSKAKNLGAKINSPALELRPFVTADGKYLFFVSNRKKGTGAPGNGSQDIYWVDAGFLDKLR